MSHYITNPRLPMNNPICIDLPRRPPVRSGRGLKQYIVLGVLLLGSANANAWFWSDDKPRAGDARELQWEELVPPDFVAPEDPLNNMTLEEIDALWDGSEESEAKLAEIEAILSYAPTRPELDGERVRIPGYIVPLEFDGQTRFKEFLLVPYYGACIHTPPPPANQVVHVFAGEEAVEVENTYDPVWIVGSLKVETHTSTMAEAGYVVTLESLYPYENAD